MGALDSVRTQTVPPKQTIVVVDYNVELYKRLIFTVPDAVIVENTGPKGLSGARNTGTAVAKAEIVAFLDDDAEAAPDWLERLAALYDDPDVLAVGGRVEPLWEAGRPSLFRQRARLDRRLHLPGDAQGRHRGPQRHRGEHVLPRRCPEPCRRFQHCAWTPGCRSAGLRGDRAVHPRRHRGPRIPGGLRARGPGAPPRSR